MGNTDVAEYLKKEYPRYVFATELIDKLGLSKASIYRALRSLQNYDEVQYKIIEGERKKSSWKTGYRLIE